MNDKTYISDISDWETIRTIAKINTNDLHDRVINYLKNIYYDNLSSLFNGIEKFINVEDILNVSEIYNKYTNKVYENSEGYYPENKEDLDLPAWQRRMYIINDQHRIEYPFEIITRHYVLFHTFNMLINNGVKQWTNDEIELIKQIEKIKIKLDDMFNQFMTKYSHYIFKSKIKSKINNLETIKNLIKYYFENSFKEPNKIKKKIYEFFDKLREQFTFIRFEKNIF